MYLSIRKLGTCDTLFMLANGLGVEPNYQKLLTCARFVSVNINLVGLPVTNIKKL